jgi:hypothetical protein
MENTKNTQLTEKQLLNRIKYNFFRTLYSNDFEMDTSKLKSRIIEDFKKNKIKTDDKKINDMISWTLNEYRYDLMELLF